MKTQEQTLTLSNLCRGGAEEIFQRDLDKVMENIADVNTPSDVKRTITLKIEFDPAANRKSATVQFSSTTKLSGVSSVRGMVHFAPVEDEMKAFPENPNQVVLFGEISGEGQKKQ